MSCPTIYCILSDIQRRTQEDMATQNDERRPIVGICTRYFPDQVITEAVGTSLFPELWDRRKQPPIICSRYIEGSNVGSHALGQTTT